MIPDRRSFLKLASAFAGLGSAALAGLPAVLSFLSPVLRRKAEPSWIRLGDAFRFETGTPVKFDFTRTIRDAWTESRVVQSVWVYTEDGEQFTVYDPRCTHLGCSFALAGNAVFVCPCHGGKFDARTGAVVAGPPPRPLDRFESKVEDGVLFVRAMPGARA